MNVLTTDKTTLNLGGIHGFQILQAKNLTKDIEIANGFVKSITSPFGFSTVEMVFESASFSEKIKDTNTYEYSYECLIAKNEYLKHYHILQFDNNKIIAKIIDNNGEVRLLGERQNPCQILAETKIDKNVSTLNAYKLSIAWISKHRAPFANESFITTSHYQFEDGKYYDFND